MRFIFGIFQYLLIWFFMIGFFAYCILAVIATKFTGVKNE